MGKPLSELQLKKRMSILACARTMMREVGAENVNMRELAARCNLSVPTIYNKFKGKNDLLMAAVDDLFRCQLEQIILPEDQPILDQMIYFMDVACEMILNNPESSKWMFKMNPETPSRSSLLISKNFYQLHIESMQASGEVINWLSPSYLGERLYYRIRSTALEWALGHVSDQGLRHLRHCEMAFFLMGISNKPLKQRLETILRKEAPLAR